jgi:flavodoxin
MGIRMEIAIFHASKYGNGLKGAEYIKDLLEKEGHEVDLNHSKKIKAKTYPLKDMYIFIAPVYATMVSGKVQKVAKKLSKRTKGPFISIQTGADKEIKKDSVSIILEAKGWKKAAGPIKLQVKEIKGPLIEGWEKKLDKLVSNIKN